MYLNKFYLFLLMILVLIVGACNKQTSEPEALPSISIQLGEPQDHDGSRLYIDQTAPANDSSLNKILIAESVDQVMVMILDFSMYDSSGQYFDTQEFKEFSNVRDGLFQEGKLTQWAEWEKLLGDYFRVVADQNLNIEGHHATGIVAGVVGLNYVVVGLIGHGTIQLFYEGSVVAKAGETVKANL